MKKELGLQHFALDDDPTNVVGSTRGPWMASTHKRFDCSLISGLSVNEKRMSDVSKLTLCLI